MTRLAYTAVTRIAGLTIIGAMSYLWYSHLQEGQKKQNISQPAQKQPVQEPERAAATPRQIPRRIGNFVPDRIHQAADFRRGRTRTIDTIVLHTTEGSAAGAENWLTANDATEVSAHYLVWPNGEIVQLVNPADTAWHVRGWNSRSVGIEIAGHYNRPITPQQVTRTATLVSHLMDQYNVGINNVQAHADLDPGRRRDPGVENMNRIMQRIRQHQENR